MPSATIRLATGRLVRLTEADVERFTRSYDVEPTTGCWRWRRARSRDGYGMFGVKQAGVKVQLQAHRVAVYLARGRQIPSNLTVDHVCRVTDCVNPEHLDLVTITTNVRRAADARGTCSKGHRYEAANVYLTPDGQRRCRTCRRAVGASYRERRRRSEARQGG